ncbi:TIGR00153 family protein [Desulfocapsa sulfexigens DSM 10523]|uniref:TIGR00153 family protein n=1 Tax=Desulfocapsa sulfexigens (strain DSM 10523 / SB164P1) TaxID=1167006 RepID=M1PJF3_DESSD|nr:TIGR00153 family protein [Desulfocapsa sulfexigens]AGF76626.1 TIGR00153 family protein [Desulfocapsa sulfexigens DSM 10523]
MVAMSTNPLAGLLRKSPFKPIQEHMRTVFSCVMLLPALFDALYRKEQGEVTELAGQIGVLETEADGIKATYRHNMPKTLLLPVDRKDLLSLIHEQDSVADGVEKISQLLVNRDMTVPDAIKGGLDELLEGTMEIITQAKNMVEELDELVHVGFSGREHDKVSRMIDGVRKSEHNLDKILKKVNRTLFTIEKELDPVSVMFWYRIIEEIGNISDHAENMADRLLLFLSK